MGYNPTLQWWGRNGSDHAPVYGIGGKSVDPRTLEIVDQSAAYILGPELSHIILRSGADSHSRNHGSGQDVGQAVDVYFVMNDGSTLKYNDPRYKALTVDMAARGAQQFGLGSNYMGDDGLHVGVGTPGRDNSGSVRVWNDSDPGGTSYRPPGATLSDNYGAPGWSQYGIVDWKGDLQTAYSGYLQNGYAPRPREDGWTPAARDAGVVPPVKDGEVPPEEDDGAPRFRGVVPPQQPGVGPYGITAAPDVAVASAPVNNEFFSTMNLPDDTPYRSPEVGAGVRPPDPLTTQRPNLGGPRGFGNVDPDGAWGPVYDLFGWQRPSQREEAVQQPQGNGGFSQPPSAYYTPQQLPNGQMLLNPGQFDVGENDTWNAPPPPTQQWVEVPSYHGFIEAPPPPQ